MKRILMSLTMLTVLASASLLQAATLPLTAKAPSAPQQAGALIPIVFQSALGSFEGVYNITRFIVQNGQLVATGRLTGTVRDAAGTIVGTVNQVLSLPVLLGGATTGTCEILNLVLGPLDLNLLGLRVQLNQVELNITAESGPGNLLGNLLCAVAGLLDNGGPLAGLAGLLNNILRVLGGL